MSTLKERLHVRRWGEDHIILGIVVKCLVPSIVLFST